ncbi:MAG: hypothetical protein ABJF86_12190 [Tateyamaria sp.]|uniref:hypothetical protein n=1 Tax=Tateyamaria sp. TaxID=1929288 RepID=UPI0032865713
MQFRDAIEQAKKMLEGISEIPTQAEIMAKLALEAIRRGQQEEITMLVELSATQGLSWEATRLVALELIYKQEELPTPLRLWLMDFLSEKPGEEKRPKRPSRWSRGWPGDNIERDHLIHSVVQSLVDQGMTPATRNDTSAEISACDAVSKALVAIGYRKLTSYKEIKRIYLDRKAEIRDGRNLLSPVAVMSQVITGIQ